MTIRDDHALAADLATEAGERLLALRGREGFAHPPALRAEGDRLAHVFLTEALARLRPSDSVLSEEATREERENSSRLTADRVWIVDPLDGTREFAERRAGPDSGSLRNQGGPVGSATVNAAEGRADWAVHVALWERGKLVAGAVALPAQGRTLSTAEPPKLPPFEGGRFRIAVSRTRPPEFVQKLAFLAGADLVPIGSAGAKISAVLTGEVEAYVHAGGQYEWDSAAPVAVAQASGAFTSRIDGSELAYNQEDPTLPDILVSLPELAPTLLAGIRDLHR
ncbi:3'(2'),5'-bisphosphate nucleotidase CysQ [Nonomuraea africana]|uniref:inositol-phosphate phosphatase n=1 Tax=Nonomuraea africana TaxID=46171 RepID=A0ABR9KNB1_9ACTN|nr:3'(2'),5'-bisphosphate nucleotidase CysQ [Nonomuraea africana]MBE1563509.1 3'(2'), 5'-bisphosphate nucleotidase [Nonomuraea africana]